MDCKREESEDRQEVKEEEEEKDEEEELGGGRAAELQTEDLSPAGPSPTEPEPSAASVPVQTSQCSFYSELLRSAAVCLPGSRDRSGRALLTVCTLNPVWSLCDPKDLLRLLLYYTSTLRKQVSALGLTVLVDARRAAPNHILFSSLRSLKDKEPGSVHSVLLLVNKDSAVHLHTPADTQVLFSLKALQKQVDLQQLPAELGGSFRFSHSSWLCFRSMLDQLSSQCADVIDLLQVSISALQMEPVPAALDAERLLSSFQEVMSVVLRNERVVRLQLEGGASLTLLREGLREKESEEVMEVQALYEQVDELLHRLVSLNNLRSNQLASIRSFRGLEEGFTQVQAWLQDVGEPRLKRLSEAEDSLEKKQREFKEFHSTAYDWSRRGSSLLAQMERWVEERSCDQGSADQGSGDPWSADLQQCEVRVQRFWSELQDFSERVRTAGQNLEREGRLSSFLDQAYGWALQGMRHLAGVRMEDCKLPDKCQAVIGCLEEYRLQHPPLPDARFQEMREEAGHLRGGRGLQQWSFAWSKCQETEGVFDRKLEALRSSRSSDSAHKREYDSSHYSEASHNRSSDSSHNSKESDSAHKQLSGSAHNRSSDSSHYSKKSDSAHNRSSHSSHHSKESDSAHNRSSAPFRRTLSALWGVQEKLEDSVSSPSLSSSSSSSLQASSSLRNSSSSSLRNSSTPLPPQHIPLLQRLFRSSSSDDPAPPSSSSSSFFSRRQYLRKTQSFDCPPSPPEGKWSSPVPPPEMKWSSPCPPPKDKWSSPSPPPKDKWSGPSPPPKDKWSSPSPPPKDKWSGPSPPAEQWSGPVPRSVSDPVRRGNIGVFIKGLEVSSPEAADRTLSPRISALSWAGQRPHTPLSSSSSSSSSSPAETRPRGSKLRHLVEEMVTTEREYVRSLLYTLHHYLPEMERSDLPQDLRGKRCLVFGNLSRIHDFHRDFFLKELEACWKHPLRVPHCFLRHQEQFGLYALYSKNKPKSDALLAAYGNSFFRRKQLLLGDKMDLSSYLLKPVQRMSKYALLLSDIMKEVGGAPGEELSAQEAELSALQDATNMVKFQLRHGNDLLAMDAIRDCDVNLKEQGQLIRQDEFTVCSGRRKCQRHIFLFEELVLFSKPKKVEGGLDVFIYKHSFKTADVGLTESSGDDGLSFEIWFRRRTRKNQTFVLQAASAEVKLAWTNGVARILWTQANRNKEMRLKEMVSMGVGNKPFLDIQPSDAAISDRAVHYIMKGRGARTRASIAVSVFDHSDPFKRGALTSDPPTSGPSSSGLLGPLNLHMYSQPPPEDSFIITSCIEEDETETSSQPSMTTESSGSTGSDSGCPPSSLQDDGPPHQPPPSSLQDDGPPQQLSACRPPANSIGPSTVV